MTCADKQVVCVLKTPNGLEFRGTNECNNSQAVCPRSAGEGYEKCKSICEQPGHAEIMALEAAGLDAIGSYAYIYGIDWVCRDCQVALFKAGVAGITIVGRMAELEDAGDLSSPS